MSVQEALCTAPAPRERQPRPQRRLRAPQLVQEALCTAPATRKAAAAPAAATRAAARPCGSVYCACHAKGSRGPSSGHTCLSSSRRLCVLHLPREKQPRPSGGHARRSSSRKLCVLRLPHERQIKAAVMSGDVISDVRGEDV